MAGTWTRHEAGLAVEAAAGARLALPISVPPAYDLRVRFTRHTGVHSIAVIFPLGAGRATYEVDAWGQHLGGIQNIDGRDLRAHPSRQDGLRLTNGRTYTLHLQVRPNGARALLDDRVVATYSGSGANLTVLPVWEMPEPRAVGIGAWASTTVFHAIDWRPIDMAPDTDSTEIPSPPKDAPDTAAERAPQTSADTATATAATVIPAPVPAAAATRSTQSDRTRRVLLVLANHHFFYREYGEPREELERAGISVTVAAGRRGPCRPHAHSGEGSDGGIVAAELALREVRAADFDAVLFVGGWGASAYQYAFTGRYDEPAYNGNREVRHHANRLVNEFLAHNKPTAALCNAVSVLAWARVNGESPLRGKRVCAPQRAAAAGIYDGRHAQPSCRWHPEVNGAILSPPGAIGDPGTAADDVLVDGLIVTGEDDISAREMGRQLVRILSEG